MKKGMLLIISLIFVLTACGKEKQDISVAVESSAVMQSKMQQSTEHVTIPDTKGSEKAEVINYSSYNGDWSLDGYGYDYVVENGGAFLNCNITNHNVFHGIIFTQQGATERFAELDVTGTIENDQLKYIFEDDGWGGKGTLYLSFEDKKINVTVEDYIMDENNTSGYGISGNYEFVKCVENYESTNAASQTTNTSQLTENWLSEINERNQYYQNSGYYDEVMNYWENVRGVRDVTNVLEPLYETDKQLYTVSDFEKVPELIIHLAKNEIYARHGYVFVNEDLKNYFMGCVWYQPLEEGKEFDDSVLNEIERKNLQLLSGLDTYGK